MASLNAHGAVQRLPTWRRRRFRLVPAGLLVLPVAAGVALLVGRRWYPVDDWASELAHASDVGTAHTPLVGVWSRFGWYHPGPMLFWVFAPFVEMLGSRGLLVSAGLINVLALAGVVVVADRRAGPKGAVLAAVIAATLCRSLATGIRAGVLLDSWNPYVTLLPFLLFVLLVWSIMCQDLAALPWAVGIGSFVVQTHVGYTILVVGVLAAGLGWFLIERGRRPTADPSVPSLRRPFVVAVTVGVVLWSAPVIQQVTGHPGNLGQIVHYFRHPTVRALGLRAGMGVVGRELSFPGAWITGHDPSVAARGIGLVVPTASTVPALMLTFAASVLGVSAWWRGDRDAGRFAAIVVVTVGAATLTTAHIVGPVYPYLLFWSWVIGALLWLSIALSAVSLLRPVIPRSRAIAGAALGTLAVLTVVNTYGITPVQLPAATYSAAVANLVRVAAPKLDTHRRYAIDSVHGLHIGSGFGIELQRRGYLVGLDERFAFQYGAWRVARRPVGATLIVVSGSSIDSGWRPPPESRLLGGFDPLTPSERLEATQLQTQIHTPAKSTRTEYQHLGFLLRKGDFYKVYMVDS